jgi:hypothetical protein
VRNQERVKIRDGRGRPVIQRRYGLRPIGAFERSLPSPLFLAFVGMQDMGPIRREICTIFQPFERFTC